MEAYSRTVSRYPVAPCLRRFRSTRAPCRSAVGDPSRFFGSSRSTRQPGSAVAPSPAGKEEAKGTE